MSILNLGSLDLGSIVITKNINGTHLEFEGLSSDFSKLQAASRTEALSNMATGSTCLLYNPTAFYKYEKDNYTWYAL